MCAGFSTQFTYRSAPTALPVKVSFAFRIKPGVIKSWTDIFPELVLLSMFKDTLISHMAQPSLYITSALSAKADKQLMRCFSKKGSCIVWCQGRSADSSLSLKSKRAGWICGVVPREFCRVIGNLSTQINLEITTESFFLRKQHCFTR